MHFKIVRLFENRYIKGEYHVKQKHWYIKFTLSKQNIFAGKGEALAGLTQIVQMRPKCRGQRPLTPTRYRVLA